VWILDDITPLRALGSQLLQQDAAFLEARPVTQRIQGRGGWVEGDAGFSGANPPAGAVITYYQRTRHLFGPINLEILDADGKLVDSIPAGKRRGINRVTWAMRMSPPRVPKAAQVAFGASQGPRVLPGTYTVRLTKGKQVYQTKLPIGLDRRAAFGLADRKAQFDAAMRVHGLFGDMTALVDRIGAARMQAGQRAAKLPEKDALQADLTGFSAHADAIRKKIVATKEGGAITGEERLREHTDTLYGAILSYEGRPAQYQLDRIDALRRELEDVVREFDALAAKELPTINQRLKAKGLPAVGPEQAAGG
jgi:hypothetical protein